jgi:hypothetical protein
LLRVTRAFSRHVAGRTTGVTMKTKFRSRGSLVALALLAMATVAPSLAVAQAQETVENRLKRVETELRAVQRKVFPDGAGKTFAPEITAATTPAPAAVGTPAAGAVTDLLSRMDAVEQQLQRLTAQTEENQNRMGKLEARLTALEPAPAPSPAPEAAIDAGNAGRRGYPPAGDDKARCQPATVPAPAATPTPATPSADRVAAVRAIESPSPTMRARTNTFTAIACGKRSSIRKRRSSCRRWWTSIRVTSGSAMPAICSAARGWTMASRARRRSSSCRTTWPTRRAIALPTACSTWAWR